MKSFAKLTLILSSFAIAPSFAKEGDNDVVTCNAIRSDAAESCSQEQNPADYDACYSSEVTRMVDEFNHETNDLSGGGELVCEK